MKTLIGIMAIVTLLISSVHSNRVQAEELSVSSFKDISGHWAEKTISEARKASLIKGYEDGSFRPNKSVTRGEFAAFLGRATTQTVSNVLEAVPFADVKGHWSEVDVQKVISLGFIQAADYPNGFSPDKAITRREISKWMANGLSSRSEDYKQALVDMKDTYVPVREMFKGILAAKDIPTVGLMLGTGLINGYPDLSFGLDKNTTRAEVATILLRYIDVESKKAEDFLGLRELREVGTMGTNLTTITPFQYGTLASTGKKTYLTNILHKPYTLKNKAGKVSLDLLLVVDVRSLKDYTSIYGKMFVGEGLYLRDNTYNFFTLNTITSSIDNFTSSSLNFGTGDVLLSGASIFTTTFNKTELKTIPKITSDHYDFFQKGVPKQVWLNFTDDKNLISLDSPADGGLLGSFGSVYHAN